MDVINVKLLGVVHFSLKVPCGKFWHGMRHSADVWILLDRAMDHVQQCEKCEALR